MHWLFIWWFPGFLIACFIFALQNPADYKFSSDSYVLPWLIFLSIGVLVVYLVFMLRFNLIKQFGKRPVLDELRHFLFVFVALILICLIPRTLEIGRYIKVNLVYPKSEIIAAFEAVEKMEILRLGASTMEESICRSNYESEELFQEDLKRRREHFMNLGYHERKDNQCHWFMYYRYRNELLDGYYYTGELKEINEVKPVKEMVAEVEKLKNTGDTMKIYNDVSKAFSNIGTFNYSGADIANNFDQFYFKFNRYDYAYYYDEFGNEEINNPKAIASYKICRTLFVASTYGSMFRGWESEIKNRLLFYPAFYLALFILIFKNMTRKTFLISLGVGALMPLVFALIMIAVRGFDSEEKAFTVAFLMYLVMFLGSITILGARRRNIFQGIALNLFTVASPMLALFLVAWNMAVSHSWGLYGESALRKAEIAGILGFIILLQPLFKFLYVRWYSLPEE